MKRKWKLIETKDGREICCRYFSTVSLTQALELAQKVVKEVKNLNYEETDVELSVSSRNFLLTLHSHSSGKVSKKESKVLDSVLPEQILKAV